VRGVFVGCILTEVLSTGSNWKKLASGWGDFAKFANMNDLMLGFVPFVGALGMSLL
jgi:hypothetical protein